jgi:hypothetical protein
VPVKAETGVWILLQQQPLGPAQVLRRPRPRPQPQQLPFPPRTPDVPTQGAGQGPANAGTDAATLDQPTADRLAVQRRPRAYSRPSIDPTNLPLAGQFDPLRYVPVSSGRHPAHQLPAFETPNGAAQCLLSGHGRRYWIDDKGVRRETGMPVILRGFGPIMRDVPAFTHHAAGCLLLVYRREDARKGN